MRLRLGLSLVRSLPSLLRRTRLALRVGLTLLRGAGLPLGWVGLPLLRIRLALLLRVGLARLLLLGRRLLPWAIVQLVVDGIDPLVQRLGELTKHDA